MPPLPCAGYPQPASLLEYTAGVFKCASKYALCR